MSERSWTVLELLRWTAQHFEERGIEAARLDAEVLLAHSLACSRLDLYLNYEKPISPAERAEFRELVVRRGRDRVPVSHLLAEKEFWSLRIGVTPDVLTPRPDTETLVSWALDKMPEPDGEYRVLDVGTGSGAIALAIASERPKARVTATDISSLALKVARENAEQLQLSEGIHFVEGGLFEAVAGETYDLVLSNPPYLARSKRAMLPPELGHEPEVALFGGDDGLDVLRPLVAGARAALVAGGFFGVELDPEQADTIATWCCEAGLTEVTTVKDLAQQVRIVAARRESVQAEASD